MVNSKRLTKEELAKLTTLFSIRRTGAGQQRQQLNDYWQLLAEKYHFHSDHKLIHNERGEIVDKCLHD